MSVDFVEHYVKHFALNLGQALQGMRYFSSHPDVDGLSPRGSFRHAILSMRIRSKNVVNDLFFALLPPQWHHSQQELRSMSGISTLRWFQYGYCAWRFAESGEPKQDLSGVDKRWDPRCSKQ